MKKYGSYLAVLGSLIVVGAVVVGAYGEFCTIKEHVRDITEIKAVQASQQKQIREDSWQDRIWWLDQWIRDTEKQFGEGCARCTGRVKQDYKDYTEELKNLKELLQKSKGG